MSNWDTHYCDPILKINQENYSIYKTEFGWMLFVNDEYNFDIKYCPECGVKLQ